MAKKAAGKPRFGKLAPGTRKLAKGQRNATSTKADVARSKRLGAGNTGKKRGGGQH